MAAFLAEEVFEEAGHAQWVFVSRKMLRPYFPNHCELLGGLAQAAWETVRDLMCVAVGALHRDVPGTAMCRDGLSRTPVSAVSENARDTRAHLRPRKGAPNPCEAALDKKECPSLEMECAKARAMGAEPGAARVPGTSRVPSARDPMGVASDMQNPRMPAA
jgi:hypothetical protein